MEECALYALTEVPTPWVEDRDLVLTWVNTQVRHDAIACGVINLDAPRADELLLAHGWPAGTVTQWCDQQHREDAVLMQVQQQGLIAVSGNGSPVGSSLVENSHAVSAVLPETAGGTRYWWLLLCRKDEPFTPLEQQTAAIVLRKWQCAFNHFRESGMGRMIVGHDDRLIIADVCLQARMLVEPDLAPSLIERLKQVVAQRYPALADETDRDVALPVGDHKHWISFRRTRETATPEGEHWFIELRPLGDDDLPPVGKVEDDRIASAIAFLHDNYPQSPNLADVARHVHMSPFHFHRLFSRQVGVSPKQYLQRRQLQIAKWLLRSTRKPVGDIAAETGFSSHGHFTSTFHRLVGRSPSEYRERA